MVDFTKIMFNEIDDTDTPLQVFYWYDLTQNEIDKLLKEYVTCEKIPEGVSIQKVELCLDIYSRHDFKLEACCTSTDNEQYWLILNRRFSNANNLIQMIPDCEKLKILDLI